MSQSDIIRKADRFGRAAIRERLLSPQMVQKTTAVRYPYGSRIAYCKTDAGAGSTIVCYLDEDDSDTEITVNCNISGGSNLNAAIRRLEDGDRMIVAKIGANWYCEEGFQGSEDCVCTSP